MESLFNTPAAVREARESQKGWHWLLEILAFLALFFVCTIGQTLFILPFQAVALMRDQNYLDAAAAGDAEQIAEAAMQAAGTDILVIVSLFSTVIMTAFVLLFCKLLQKRKPASLGFVKQGSGKAYIKGAAAGFLLFSAAVFICVLTGSMKLSVEKSPFAAVTFLLFLAGYMVQGMAEETLCRGYFMVSLGRRYPMAAAVLLNAAAFAALHLLNPGVSPLAIVNLALFGIFASVCFIRTENIWLISALHSVWNFVQGNVYGIRVSGMQTSCSIFASSMTEGRELIHGGAFGLEGGLAVTAALLLGTAFLLFFKKNTNNEYAVEGI